MNHSSVQVDEITYLRGELGRVKSLQTKYVIFAFTSVGAALIANLKVGNFNGLIFLYPIFILIPLWWLYLEHEKSITMIQGYLPILEGMLLGKNNYKYIGWENSKLIYSEWANKCMLEYIDYDRTTNKEKIFKILSLNIVEQRHLVLIWYAFFFNLFVCIIFALGYSSGYVLWFLPVALAVSYYGLSMALDMLLNLVNGRYSPIAYEQFWKQTLLSHEEKN